MKQLVCVIAILCFLLLAVISIYQLEAKSDATKGTDVSVLEKVPKKTLQFMQPNDVASLLLAD